MTELKKLIRLAFDEDLGSGDITTNAVVPEDYVGQAAIRAKEPLIVAGLDIAKQVFRGLDETCQWQAKVKDGEQVTPGTTLATVSGSITTLLKGERTALNFIGRLSGISTMTRRFAEAVKNTRTQILDTRKTTPGWRSLEKYAVLMGGGNNHRIGLFDRYLIKNNHIKVAGSLKNAVERVLSVKEEKIMVELEVKSLDELKEALAFPLDLIMLDNFSISQVSDAVRMTRGLVKLEASGGINLENVSNYAKTGVDFISIGALTHSASAADIHMLLL